jgi:hypothetical protein
MTQTRSCVLCGACELHPGSDADFCWENERVRGAHVWQVDECNVPAPHESTQSGDPTAR